MEQIREELTQNLAERLCWLAARRDDVRVVRRLYRQQEVDGVYRLDEGALLDDLFPNLTKPVRVCTVSYESTSAFFSCCQIGVGVVYGTNAIARCYTTEHGRPYWIDADQLSRRAHRRKVQSDNP
jgi:hypothetical protein